MQLWDVQLWSHHCPLNGRVTAADWCEWCGCRRTDEVPVQMFLSKLRALVPATHPGIAVNGLPRTLVRPVVKPVRDR